MKQEPMVRAFRDDFRGQELQEGFSGRKESPAVFFSFFLAVYMRELG